MVGFGPSVAATGAAQQRQGDQDRNPRPAAHPHSLPRPRSYRRPCSGLGSAGCRVPHATPCRPNQRSEGTNLGGRGGQRFGVRITSQGFPRSRTSTDELLVAQGHACIIGDAERCQASGRDRSRSEAVRRDQGRDILVPVLATGPEVVSLPLRRPGPSGREYRPLRDVPRRCAHHDGTMKQRLIRMT